MLDLFGESCTERKYSFVRLDGSTPTNTRMGIVDRFNDPQGADRNFSYLRRILLLLIQMACLRNLFIEFEGWRSRFKFDRSITTYPL